MRCPERIICIYKYIYIYINHDFDAVGKNK